MLKQGNRTKNDSGFTLLEFVIAIPVIGLVGTIAFLLLAQNILIMNENNLTRESSQKVQEISEYVSISQSCGDIAAVEEYDGSTFHEGTSREFSIQVTAERVESVEGLEYEDVSPTAGCHDDGATMRVLVEAVRSSDEKVLFYKENQIVLNSGTLI